MSILVVAVFAGCEAPPERRKVHQTSVSSPSPEPGPPDSTLTPGEPGTTAPSADTGGADGATGDTGAPTAPPTCINATAQDFGIDGTTDAVGYDELEGDRLVHSEMDIEQDGTPDYVADYAYDSGGNLVSVLTTQDHTTTTLSQTWDGDHHLLSSSFDSNGDGAFDTIYRATWDTAGSLATESWDQDGDGFPDQSSTYARDGSGTITSVDRDTDGFGGTDAVDTWSYDGAGRASAVDTDLGPDGTIDDVLTIVYDASTGATRTETTDLGDDGAPDRFVRFEYDSAGRQTKFESDDDADGVWDAWDDRTFDANGNLLTEDEVSRTWSSEVSFAWTYDAEGRVIQRDDHIEFASSYTYSFDIRNTWEYDPGCP